MLVQTIQTLPMASPHLLSHMHTTHSPCLTYAYPHTHHASSHICTPTHSPCLTYAHPHTHHASHMHTHTLTMPPLTYAHPHTHHASHMHTHTLTMPPLTYAHPHTHHASHMHTHTLTMPHICTPTHSPCLLSHMHTHTLTMQEWWKVESDGQQGYVPASYMKRLEVAAPRRDSSVTSPLLMTSPLQDTVQSRQLAINSKLAHPHTPHPTTHPKPIEGQFLPSPCSPSLNPHSPKALHTTHTPPLPPPTLSLMQHSKKLGIPK